MIALPQPHSNLRFNLCHNIHEMWSKNEHERTKVLIPDYPLWSSPTIVHNIRIRQLSLHTSAQRFTQDSDKNHLQIGEVKNQVKYLHMDLDEVAHVVAS